MFHFARRTNQLLGNLRLSSPQGKTKQDYTWWFCTWRLKAYVHCHIFGEDVFDCWFDARITIRLEPVVKLRCFHRHHRIHRHHRDRRFDLCPLVTLQNT